MDLRGPQSGVVFAIGCVRILLLLCFYLYHDWNVAIYTSSGNGVNFIYLIM